MATDAELLEMLDDPPRCDTERIVAPSIGHSRHQLPRLHQAHLDAEHELILRDRSVLGAEHRGMEGVAPD